MTFLSLTRASACSHRQAESRIRKTLRTKLLAAVSHPPQLSPSSRPPPATIVHAANTPTTATKVSDCRHHCHWLPLPTHPLLYLHYHHHTLLKLVVPTLSVAASIQACCATLRYSSAPDPCSQPQARHTQASANKSVIAGDRNLAESHTHVERASYNIDGMTNHNGYP